MSAVVLTPRKLAVQEPDVHRWHFRRAIVFWNAKVFDAEKPEDRLGRDRGHEAALMIEPLDCSSITRYDIT